MGPGVGETVGELLGTKLGFGVGALAVYEGDRVGIVLGKGVGDLAAKVGTSVGFALGVDEGAFDGIGVGLPSENVGEAEEGKALGILEGCGVGALMVYVGV